MSKPKTKAFHRLVGDTLDVSAADRDGVGHWTSKQDRSDKAAMRLHIEPKNYPAPQAADKAFYAAA